MNARLNKAILASILLLAFTVVFSSILQLRKQVAALEKICHGQCKYGDSECAKRCDAEGHCPQQD